MRNLHSSRAATWAASVLIGAFVALPTPALAASDAELDALREQVRLLDQKLRVLERHRELDAEAAAAAPLPPVVAVDRRGLYVETADKANYLRIRPRFQIDGHWFPDKSDGSTDIAIRRARPTAEGRVGLLSWRLTPEFAGTVRIIDAWADVALTPDLFIRAGKIKTAVGYERLQSFSRTLFTERGLPSALTTTRDIGVQLHGVAAGGIVEWSAGLTSGALDDTDLSANLNFSPGDFDIEARVFVQPFLTDAEHLLNGLGFGFAAQTGTENVVIDDADRDRRIRYRTAARNTFFRYNDGVAIDGDRTRLNAFLSYYHGPLGVMAEWIRGSYDLTRAGVTRQVDTDAWTIQAGWILTGEKASYNGFRPAKPFAPSKGQWGGFEIGARYNVFDVDDAAFIGTAAEVLARNGSVQQAEGWGVALNWVLTDNLLVALDYEFTDFSGLGANRDSEQVVLSRLQVEF